MTKLNSPPDFRALCAELVAIEDALSSGSVQFSNQGQALDGYSALATFRDVADRARAALAAEAVGPSDEELWSLCRATGGGSRATDTTWFIRFARAVLARYSAPRPIPVAERLPGAGDCDAEGRCWWGESCETGATWEFYSAAPTTALWTHWLPAHALPTCSQQEGADG